MNIAGGINNLVRHALNNNVCICTYMYVISDVSYWKWL